MKSFQNRILLELKSRLFELIQFHDRVIKYEDLLTGMLFVVKNISEADDVSLYLCNHWKKQIFVEASTKGETAKHSAATCIELSDISFDFLMRHPFPFSELNNYTFLLPLRENEEKPGFLAFVGATDFFENMSEETTREFSLACTKFLHEIQSIWKIIMDERRYKRLFRVTEKFHSTMDIDVVLGEVINTLQEIYPSFQYYLLISHDNHNHGDLPIKDLEYDSDNLSAMQAYVTGMIQIDDSLQERRSILYAPLKGRQGVYGVLQVIAPDTLIFPKNEIEFITLLANTAGSAMENAKLYQQSRRLISDLQLINETSRRINSNLRLTEMTSFMAEQIKKSFHADEVGFVFISEGFEKTDILSGSTDFFFTEEAEIYIKYVAKKIQVEKDSLFIGDLSSKDELPGRLKYKSLMAVPMIQTGVIKGFSLVVHQRPYFFSFETFKLLQALIHHSTLAFTNSILREELEKMVITDHLTKLYSRNYLDKRIQQSMNEDQQGTFILMDIDNFKQINDTYGHQVGDKVLIQVAQIIKNNIRGSDIGARWGGEELAIYLPKVPIEIGVAVAERLVKKVSMNSDPNITISCGVSHWEHSQEDSYHHLFRRADNALYKAKETGKNKVVTQNQLTLP